MINPHHSITSLCKTNFNWDPIFNLSPRALGLAEHYDDLEDLTTEKPDVNERLRKEAIWKVSNAYYKHWCMIQWHTEQNICNCRAPLFSWEESLSTCSSRPSTTSPPQAGTMEMCESSELVSGKIYILEIIVWAGIHVLCEDNLNLRLYYEFVNYSTIGFGDLIPSDEATVGGRWHIQ